MFCICNVKTAHKRFPKTLMNEELIRRGDQVHCMVKVPGKPYRIFASGHFDKTPMSLVHTCGTSLPGPPRRRVYRYYDEEAFCDRSVVLELMQPQTHSRYRSCFWMVDRHNSLALGPQGLHVTVKVTIWHLQMFLALLSIAVTNAFLAFNHAQVQRNARPVTFQAFEYELARTLIESSHRSRGRYR